jgi:hypothetical protein
VKEQGRKRLDMAKTVNKKKINDETGLRETNLVSSLFLIVLPV